MHQSSTVYDQIRVLLRQCIWSLLFYTFFHSLSSNNISARLPKTEMMMRLRQFGEINSVDVDFICAACFRIIFCCFTVKPLHMSTVVIKKSDLQ